MNEKQIECFLTVSKYQSFSRAAQALFMTQPTVTHQIAALEEELGFSLFVRSYRAISLTPAGQRFEERMRPAVEQLQSIVSECKQIARNEDSCLTLGHYFPEGDWMFYHAIYAFSSLYPAFHIDTHLPPSTELVDRLLTRQLDAIVAPHQLITVQDELKQTTLFSNPEYCVMSRNHPMAERESLTLNDLQDTLCLLDNDDPFKIKTWHETQIRAQRSQFSSRNGRTMREIVTNLRSALRDALALPGALHRGRSGARSVCGRAAGADRPRLARRQRQGRARASGGLSAPVLRRKHRLNFNVGGALHSAPFFAYPVPRTHGANPPKTNQKMNSKRRKKENARFKIGRMFLAPQVGLEPTTLRLTAECSAIELLRNMVD